MEFEGQGGAMTEKAKDEFPVFDTGRLGWGPAAFEAPAFTEETDHAVLAAIVECSDDAILSKTLDGTIMTWNPAAERMFGYTPLEAIGQSILMLIPEDRRGEESHIQDCLQRGERVDHLETVRLAKDGRELQVSITSSPIRNQAGAVVGASKIVRDVTETRQLEAALLSEQLAMEHLVRVHSMGELASGLAHELNQPLESILNYAGTSLQLLRSPNATREDVAPALERVIRETKRAGEIIGRIRDAVRKRVPRLIPVSVPDLVEETINLLANDLRRDGIAVHHDFPPNQAVVRADRVQLTQVLVNLVGNARDAMAGQPPSQRTLTIRSSFMDGNVVVRVIDSGSGLDSAGMSRLFTRFYSTKPEGLGMGLAISKSIISSFGGTLEAAANVGAPGMTFTIVLPRAAMGSSDEQQTPRLCA